MGENSLEEVKSFLRDIKDTLENMQKMISEIFKALIRINAVTELSLFISEIAPNLIFLANSFYIIKKIS